MKLHENQDLFADAVSITAQRITLPELYVEKDYWVTLALHRIFTGPLAHFTVFKGGTALAKGFSFIHRFSEDIDLVLAQEAPLSAVLPEREVVGITNKKGMIRKTAHDYAQVFTGDFGQVRDLIIVESSWLGSATPTTRSQGQFVCVPDDAGERSGRSWPASMSCCPSRSRCWLPRVRCAKRL